MINVSVQQYTGLPSEAIRMGESLRMSDAG
jgi:hypothetical protein